MTSLEIHKVWLELDQNMFLLQGQELSFDLNMEATWGTTPHKHVGGTPKHVFPLLCKGRVIHISSDTTKKQYLETKHTQKTEVILQYMSSLYRQNIMGQYRYVNKQKCT